MGVNVTALLARSRLRSEGGDGGFEGIEILDSVAGGFAIDALNQTAENVADAAFHEGGDFVAKHVLDGFGPADGGNEGGAQELGKVGFTADGLAGDVAVDRANVLGLGPARLFEPLGESFGGGGHERAMEGPADLEGQHAFGPGFLGGMCGGFHRSHLSGDNELAGAVIVGDHDDSFGHGREGFFERGAVEAEDGGHGSRSFAAGRGHELAAVLNKLGAFGEIEDSGGDAGGELANAVAGDGIDPDFAIEVALEAAKGGDGDGEEGELGVLGLAEGFFVAIEAQGGDIDAGGVVDGGERGLGFGAKLEELPAHAGLLGALAGEDGG